ncbi:MAG: DUF420 domain-containing protein [Bacteroidia bacterium]|nr:DUF420 domain-containing protein [Bacteroidia bacterium]
MSTEKKSWISDRNFFSLVVGISLAVPAVVITLRFLPAEMRPNAHFASLLPFANAVLNSLVSVALVAGYYFIRVKKQKQIHQAFMLTAFALSAVFLISYVVYHMIMPHTPFGGQGVIRYFYFAVLLTHIVLAACILPLVLYTIYFSTTGRLDKHKKLARWTFPVWLYVSVTGVLVYVLISPYYSF